MLRELLVIGSQLAIENTCFLLSPIYTSIYLLPANWCTIISWWWCHKKELNFLLILVILRIRSCVCQCRESKQKMSTFLTVYCTIVVIGAYQPKVLGRKCISQLTDLEASLLNHSGNIENLTRAFLPPNQPSPSVVRTCYYVEPAASHSMLSGDCDNAMYIFQWSTSPVFLYAPADVLKALTFSLAQITEQTVVLTIDAPVCDILLINYLTTLVSC